MKENVTRRLFRILFRCLAYRPPALDVPAPGAVLAGVSVVNPGRGRAESRTLRVAGERIAHLGSGGPVAAAGPGAGRYAGCYVLPGLIDMHVHVPPHVRPLVDLLFLAHGVTAVREVGDADGTTWRARDRIRAGERPGPRLFCCGPVLDGAPPFLPTSWAIRDAAGARAAVAALAARGADCVKVHHTLSAEVLAAICRAADEAGLRVVGHVPAAVPFEAAGIWDVQHLDGLVPYPQPPETPLDHQKGWRDLDPARIDAYVRVSVAQGLVHTPTLVAVQALARMADPQQAADPAVRWLPRHFREGMWDPESVPFFKAFTGETLALMQRSLARRQEVVGRLHRAGVRLHLGTDTLAVPFDVPGASLQQELALMVEAGLSLEAAWAAGTWAAGQSLGRPRLGTVQVGAPADLLVFGADPTRDPAAWSTLRAVIAQGRLYTKPSLDAALARHRARFERPLYDRLSTAVMRLGGRLM